MLYKEEFNFLPETEKLSYLRRQGRFLASRKTHIFEIKLYWLHYFFVEVYFQPGNFKCAYTGTFHGTQMLDPYLDNIQLGL